MAPMMEKPEQDVTTDSSTVTTPAEGQKPEVNVLPTENPAPGNEPLTQEVSKEVVKPVEPDVNWKNKAHEYQRKLAELSENLPNIIREQVSQLKAPQTKPEPEYGIADLKAFAETTDDVAHKRWAYAEIEKLERDRIEKILSEREQKARMEVEREQTKRAVVAEVLNDARYADAFIEEDGQKKFNPESPLFRAADRYLADPALANRPDALRIAMKLAYADFAPLQAGAIQRKVEGMKNEITKIKQTTLIEGAGEKPAAKRSTYDSAISDLAKTGSKSALRAATLEILKAQGVIK